MYFIGSFFRKKDPATIHLDWHFCFSFRVVVGLFYSYDFMHGSHETALTFLFYHLNIFHHLDESLHSSSPPLHPEPVADSGRLVWSSPFQCFCYCRRRHQVQETVCGGTALDHNHRHSQKTLRAARTHRGSSCHL